MLCRKSLKASASLLQVGGRTERHAKAKNFTISSNACSADRKMRMTPPRSFSLSPCDARSRCTSRVCTTRRLTVTCVHRTAEHAEREREKKQTFYRFLICADEWIHKSAHRHPSAQLPGTQTNVTMNVEKTLKQNQNKQQPYSHTSLQQDVLSKTNMLVSLWSVHLFTLVALQNHIARTGPLLVQNKLMLTKKIHNTKHIGFHLMAYLLPHTDSICIPYQMTNSTNCRLICLSLCDVKFLKSINLLLVLKCCLAHL